MEKTIPRGIRNNNPLNIRRSSQPWVGKMPIPTDKDFEQFESLAHGIRAAYVCIRTYCRRMNSVCITPTIARIIERWAPPSENNTAAYITAVCRHSNGRLYRDKHVIFEDKDTLVWLLWCMSFVENGVDLPWSEFSQAYEMV